jgi:hypothetical protein
MHVPHKLHQKTRTQTQMHKTTHTTCHKCRASKDCCQGNHRCMHCGRVGHVCLVTQIVICTWASMHRLLQHFWLYISPKMFMPNNDSMTARLYSCKAGHGILDIDVCVLAPLEKTFHGRVKYIQNDVSWIHAPLWVCRALPHWACSHPWQLQLAKRLRGPAVRFSFTISKDTKHVKRCTRGDKSGWRLHVHSRQFPPLGYGTFVSGPSLWHACRTHVKLLSITSGSDSFGMSAHVNFERKVPLMPIPQDSTRSSVGDSMPNNN